MSYARPGWFGAASQMFSPFARESYSGNPIDNQYDNAGVVGSKPVDAAAWIGQRVATPMAAMWGASNLGGAALGRWAGRGLVGGLASGMGMGGAAGAAGSLGAAAGGFLGPLALGIGAAELVNQSIFQPYARSAMMSDEVNRNFRGVSFGGAMGNPMSGRGLSFMESARIGTGIDRQGWKDMTFSGSEYKGIASMGMRAGLFDDVQSNQILERVKSVASQVKLLMAISKDLTTQSAVEELARLRLGGASVAGGVFSQAARAYSNIGMSASIAGISTTSMMARGGALGANIYSANGMTPYLGAMAGATSMAGFAVAERLGLMAPAHLARLGGLEGAAGSSLGGQMAAGSSPYNQVRMYNQFFGGGAQGSVTGNALAFSRAAGNDPLTTMGNMALYGKDMQQAQARINGSRDAEDQAISILKSLHQGGRGPGGKYLPGQLAAIYTSHLGMSPEQANAYTWSRYGETNSSAVGASRRAMQSQVAEQFYAVAAQEELYDTALGRTWHSVKSGLNSAGGGLANTFAYPAAMLRAGASEMVQSVQQAFMGDVIEKTGQSIDIDQIARNRGASGKVIATRFGVATDLPAYERALYKEINAAAGLSGERGDLAKKILSSGSKDPSARKYLAKFAQTSANPLVQQAYEQMAGSPEFMNRVTDSLSVAGIIKSGDTPKAIADEIATLAYREGFSTMDNLKVIGQANAFMRDVQANGGILRDNLDLLSDPKYADINRILSKMNDKEKGEYLDRLNYGATSKGYYGAAEMAYRGSSEGDIRKTLGGLKSDAWKGTRGTAGATAQLQNTILAHVEKSIAIAKGESTEVAYETFRDASDTMSKAGDNMLKASENLLRAAGMKPDEPSAAPIGLGSDSTQKTQSNDMNDRFGRFNSWVRGR